MKALQIIFCVLACLCVAAVVPVGIWCSDLIYILLPLAGAVAFGLLMMLMKKLSAPKPPKKKDFMDEE